MELRELRSLVMLAEERHFTRAAQRLHIAQPALSQQIRKLEAEVGLPLVDRTTRRVSITEAGELLVGHARRMLAEADDATAGLRELAGVEKGRITIGASPTLGGVDLPVLLAEFNERFPNIDIIVREDLSVRLGRELHNDTIDVAFVTSLADPAIDRQLIASEPLVCLVAPGHPLARWRDASLLAFKDERFAMFRPGATIRGHVEAELAAHGVSPLVTYETNDVARITTLVASGLAVAVLPASDGEAAHPAVVSIPLRETSLTHNVYLAWRRGRRPSPALREFIALTASEAPDGRQS